MTFVFELTFVLGLDAVFLGTVPIDLAGCALESQ